MAIDNWNILPNKELQEHWFTVVTRLIVILVELSFQNLMRMEKITRELEWKFKWVSIWRLVKTLVINSHLDNAHLNVVFSKSLVILIINLTNYYILEKAMATHSSTLAWKIPWMEEPGGLQSMGSLQVGHDWATTLSVFTSCIGEGNGNPLHCLAWRIPGTGEPGGAAVYGVAQSQTRLKRLSSSSYILLWLGFISKLVWYVTKKGKIHSLFLFPTITPLSSF